MAKTISNTVYDAALDRLALANAMHLCNGQPGSYAEVLSNSLGSVSIDTTDFTISDGDTSGRKVAIAAQTGFSITQTSTLDHVAFVDSAQILLAVTTHAATAVTSGDSRNSATFDLELYDPS